MSRHMDNWEVCNDNRDADRVASKPQGIEFIPNGPEPGWTFASSYVHFATHADLPGSVQGVNEPFILPGQVDKRKDSDGFLTMSKVLGLELMADMVVLSACLTGRGKLPEVKEQKTGVLPSPSMVQRDMPTIIREIGMPARLPKPRGISHGRLKGQSPGKRNRFPLIIKSTKKGQKYNRSP